MTSNRSKDGGLANFSARYQNLVCGNDRLCRNGLQTCSNKYCYATHTTLVLLRHHMRITEVVTKPPSPQQQRVDQLKTQLDVARRAAKTARLNQQQVMLNQQRQKLRQA
jgi:hypothetical protein